MLNVVIAQSCHSFHMVVTYQLQLQAFHLAVFAVAITIATAITRMGVAIVPVAVNHGAQGLARSRQPSSFKYIDDD